jgi:hydroxymethylpyrimidine/phosphomethylpyrimidine kinase
VKIALTVAGSDSGGGAGIQADLKTFARFGVFGTSAITAVTAQNTRGVTMWEPVSPALVEAQIDTVFADLQPHAVKTGMLGSAAVVQTVIDTLSDHKPRHLVVDPVMVASSGDLLLDTDAVALVRDQLIPLADLVTPNLDEAQVLLDIPMRNVNDMIIGAEQLVTTFGAKAALIKGGHLDSETIVDVLYDGQHHFLRDVRIVSSSTHGTGCTLSAAITANLALGKPLYHSVRIATEYVRNAIATAPGLGSGHGPINHFAAYDATNPLTSD